MTQRASFRQRGYGTTWDKLSRLYRQEHPLCVGCTALGIVEPASVVDHVVPPKGDHTKLFDQENLQSSCAWHHDVIKQRLEQLWARGALATEQLRLDSPKAISLARAIPRKTRGVDVNGWPIP